MTILEYLNNQIANLEDSLQHYTMVDKDKCKEIYIRTDLEQLYKIKAVVEAWQVVTNRFEYFEMEEGDVFVNSQEGFVQTEPFNTNDLKTIKKVITTKKVSGVNKGCKLATNKQIKYLKKYKCNFKHVEKNRDLLDKLINQKFDTWTSRDAWLIISELESIRGMQYVEEYCCKEFLGPFSDYPVEF